MLESWEWADTEGVTRRKQKETSYVKRDEYLLSGIRYQREQRWSSWSLGLLHPPVWQGSFWLYLVLMGIVKGQGG